MNHQVIFFHGFGSSPATNKFDAIDYSKTCILVDYANEEYFDIDKKHHEHVEQVIADGFIPIIVGHSLGGYWALRMAERFNVSCILINPQLWPDSQQIRDVDAYTDIDNLRAPKYVYIETGDEMINVSRTLDWAIKNAQLKTYQGGHHRVERLDVINQLIDQAIQEELVS